MLHRRSQHRACTRGGYRRHGRRDWSRSRAARSRSRGADIYVTTRAARAADASAPRLDSTCARSTRPRVRWLGTDRQLYFTAPWLWLSDCSLSAYTIVMVTCSSLKGFPAKKERIFKCLVAAWRRGLRPRYMYTNCSVVLFQNKPNFRKRRSRPRPEYLASLFSPSLGAWVEEVTFFFSWTHWAEQ